MQSYGYVEICDLPKLYKENAGNRRGRRRMKTRIIKGYSGNYWKYA